MPGGRAPFDYRSGSLGLARLGRSWSWLDGHLQLLP